MITTYLNALVEMLNENPPITISELHNSLKPFKVLGYDYYITSISSEDDFIIVKIVLSGKGKVYVVESYSGVFYFKSE
jgi:hypothetical protein